MPRHRRLAFILLLLLTAIQCGGKKSDDSLGFLLTSLNFSTGGGTAGTGPVPAVSLSVDGSDLGSGTTYHFSSEVAGSTSAPYSFTLQNSGAATLSIHSISLSGSGASQFQVNRSLVPSSLEPSETASFSVLFKPTSAGLKNASLNIATDDPARPVYTLQFNAEAQPVPAPEIHVMYGSGGVFSGGSLSLGGTGLCTTQREYTLTIRNIGNKDLHLTDTPAITVSGANAGDFEIVSQPVTSVILPGSSVPFTVRFTPSASGDRVATLTIPNDDADETTFQFSIKGTKLNAEIEVKSGTTWVSSGGTHQAGFIPVSQSRVIPYQIRNNMYVPLNLTGTPPVTLSGADAAVANTTQPATPIAAWASSDFNTTVIPTEKGPHNLTISIPNDDCDENPFTFSLSFTAYQSVKAAEPSWSARRGHASAVFDNRIWVMGGRADAFAKSDVYSSTNGNTWTMQTSAAPWGPRVYASALEFDGKLWLLGGMGGGCRNDAVYTTDGINWTWATQTAPWPGRFLFPAVVFNGKIWVLGGEECNGGHLNDVWYSSDGASWTQATAHAPWVARSGHVALVYDGKIWVMGGGNGPGEKMSDVWYSSDGVNWTQATDQAPWPKRSAHAAVTYNGAMWIIGGFSGTGVYNDMWMSTDGTNWLSVVPGFSSRDTATGVVFLDRIWIMGGNTSSGYTTNDVWSFLDH